MVIQLEEIAQNVLEMFEHHIEKIQNEGNVQRLKKFKIHENFKEFDKNDHGSLKLVKEDNTKTIANKIRAELPRISRLNKEMIHYWKAYVEESMTKTEYFDKMRLKFTGEQDELIINEHMEDIHRIVVGIFMDDLNFRALFNSNYTEEIKSLKELLEWLDKGSTKNSTYNEEKGLYDIIKECKYERDERQLRNYIDVTYEKIDKYMTNFEDVENPYKTRYDIMIIVKILIVFTNKKWYSEKIIRLIIGRLFNTEVEREMIFSKENLKKAMEAYNPRSQIRNRSNQREEEYKRIYDSGRNMTSIKKNDIWKQNNHYNDKRNTNRESRFEGHSKGTTQPKIKYTRDENLIDEANHQIGYKTYAITEESDEEEYHPRKKAKYGDNNH